MELEHVRVRFERTPGCAHTTGAYCFCRPKAPKPHPIAQAAAKYFFDYDDTFKVEVKEERRPEVEERGVERQVWMTVKSR